MWTPFGHQSVKNFAFISILIGDKACICMVFRGSILSIAKIQILFFNIDMNVISFQTISMLIAMKGRQNGNGSFRLQSCRP